MVIYRYCFVSLLIALSRSLYLSVSCILTGIWDNHAEWLGTPQNTAVENPANCCFSVCSDVQRPLAFPSASLSHIEWVFNKSVLNRKGRYCQILM